MSGRVINLRRHRLRRARAAVRRERLFRLQAELLLYRVEQCCRDQQGFLDHALEQLHQLKRRAA
jgi:hypothetical protein